MAPVLANPALCTYKQLLDGTYTRTDVAWMVYCLEVKAENEYLANEAQKAKSR